MKPVTTWVLLANAKEAHVVANSGPNKGLELVPGKAFKAQPPASYSDRAGMVHSSTGPGVAGVEQGDLKDQAEAAFAETLCAQMDRSLQSGAFDRLILASAPHMLGHLRKAMSPKLQAAITVELAKDLTKIPLIDLPSHLEGHMAL